MSTFYGGSQLVSVTSLSRTTDGTSSYTVPAGHWAEVWFITTDNEDSPFNSSSSGIVNGATLCSGNSSKEFGMVASGGVISVDVNSFTGNTYGYAGIKVYKNP